MGKKKSGFKRPNKKGVDSLKDAVSSSDDEGIEQHLQSVLEDEIDQYNAFKEKSLSDKANKGKKRKGRPDEDDEEQEVYDLGLTSSDEDDDGEAKEDFMKESDDEDKDDLDLEDDDDDDDEDIMGKKDDDYGIPDSRAWGKKARVFHNTDYIDQDFGGFEGSDAEMAELEEAEAKEIQKRLTAELDEDDILGLVPVPVVDKTQKASKTKEILKVDYDSMSVAEKRKLVQRECPELVHMLEEYKEKLQEAKGLKSAMVRETDQFLRKFFQSKYHSILNYCINISYYLYLRATSPTNCKGHPVIKRIVQFRRLLEELSQFDIIKYKASQDRVPGLQGLKKKRKVKSRPDKIPKLSINDVPMGQVMSLNDEEADLDNYTDDTGLEKRGITYAISKNKGLTPKRKKEQRNPRVKHREKFRKATIRRKGQVRTPRTELQRYSGEMTGIKTHVTKSIKLK